jgi:hypothetical protein
MGILSAVTRRRLIGAASALSLAPVVNAQSPAPAAAGVRDADWQLVRPDGVTSVEARYTLKAGDGTLVSATNGGLIVPMEEDGQPGVHVRTVLEFVGSLDASQFRRGRVLVRAFRII